MNTSGKITTAKIVNTSLFIHYPTILLLTPSNHSVGMSSAIVAGSEFIGVSISSNVSQVASEKKFAAHLTVSELKVSGVEYGF